MHQDTFSGAKLMLFVGSQLLVIRRDHAPEIAFQGFLDFPGGGREKPESPVECVLRETYEEVGLTIAPDQLIWCCKNIRADGQTGWFFATHLSFDAALPVRFGGEGLGWSLVQPQAYLASADAIPHFKISLDKYLAFCQGQAPN
ncbi:hypothetical protein P775_20570 [Puniceibacterium antarcticum]|uniref:Nudix hydrolase domain-containing protein n=1 Tax=Puniceibacterium antarcticum TaxID=1206336 RepID=A0A2G8R9Y2_9RHOB|nr:NUDIX domain-containing protein [Puniceibacterium antarcticum]PIL18347.1 hypothetical protein P775_20570 [Puniceibacterium antarcticum]